MHQVFPLGGGEGGSSGGKDLLSSLFAGRGHAVMCFAAMHSAAQRRVCVPSSINWQHTCTGGTKNGSIVVVQLIKRAFSRCLPLIAMCMLPAGHGANCKGGAASTGAITKLEHKQSSQAGFLRCLQHCYSFKHWVIAVQGHVIRQCKHES